MITEKLDKLDLLLLYPVEETTNSDAEFFDSIDDSNIVLSKRLDRRCRRTINQYKRRPFVNACKKVMASAAIFFLVICAAGFLTIMSVSALRNAVWESILQWYDTYVSVRFTPETPDSGDNRVTPQATTIPGETTAATTAPVVHVPTKIETVRKPTYFPIALEEDVVMQDDNIVMIDYYVVDDWHCSYRQGLLSDSEKGVDSEGTILEKVTINGCEGNLFVSTDGDANLLIWNDGEYVYLIMAMYDKDVMIQIAESVQ